jgi:hypothetical protein
LSRNLGTITSWNPLGHSRPVTRLLYLYLYRLPLSHKWDNFRGKKAFQHKICNSSLYKTFAWNILVQRKTERDIIKMYIGLHVKYQLLLSHFNETWISSTVFFKKILKYRIPRKSAQWEPSCSMRTDGLNRHNETNSRFSQFLRTRLTMTPVSLHEPRIPRGMILVLNHSPHGEKLSSIAEVMAKCTECFACAVLYCHLWHVLRLKRDGTRAETRFRLSAQRTSPFKSAGGRQFSRLLAAEVCASAVVMLDTPCSDVECKNTGYPIHSYVSPSLPLQCVTVCHQVSTELYLHVVIFRCIIPVVL